MILESSNLIYEPYQYSLICHMHIGKEMFGTIFTAHLGCCVGWLNLWTGKRQIVWISILYWLLMICLKGSKRKSWKRSLNELFMIMKVYKLKMQPCFIFVDRDCACYCTTRYLWDGASHTNLIVRKMIIGMCPIDHLVNSHQRQ